MPISNFHGRSCGCGETGEGWKEAKGLLVNRGERLLLNTIMHHHYSKQGL